MDNELTLERFCVWEEKNLIGPEKKLESNGVLEECGIITNINELKEKDLLRDTTEKRKKISGIYKIINKINGKYYVGSSLDITDRWSRHKLHLNKQIHHNEYLQKSWNKYGSDNFEFVILKEVIDTDRKTLLKEEQNYLNEAKKNKEKCYNLAFIAGGGDYGPLVREKISKALKGKYMGKDNPSYGKHLSENHKEKIKQYHLLHSPVRGKHLSEETKRKISENNAKTNLGKHLSEETKEKIRQKRIGTHHSQQSKDKIKQNAKYGENNSMFKSEKFLFKNKNTGEIFYGTRKDLYSTFNLHKGNVSLLVLRKVNEVKGWKLL